MRKLTSLLFFMLLCAIGFAQKIAYTITITDVASGNTVSNASVKMRGSNTGVSANDKGKCTIQATSGDVIDISSVGYNLVSVTLGSQTNLSVSLTKAVADLSDVVIVGTRGAARAKTETAVPIDVIKINQVGLPSAKMDFTSVLNMTAPSFNYNKQSGADGADHVDLGTLRGLGPDQTLVLINGKRRHNTAFVALFGTRGRGASGTDLNAFPQNGVDRIEILRDGASAQYGSDAIAGVMNIVLSKNVNQWNIIAGWSGYYDNKFNAKNFNDGKQYVSSNTIDGGTFNLSANNGFNVGKQGGFVNFSLDFKTQAKTFRQADTANWKTDKDDLRYINTSRRAFGDGSINTYGAMYNMELPVKNSKATFYSFGSINTKESDAYAYTRNMSSNADRFPVTALGVPINVPSIMQTTNDGETYYNPRILTAINDAAVSFGFKGITQKSWNWDVSLVTGKNDFQYFGDKTFNASLIGNTSKTYFIDGGFRFRQATLNVDLSKNFKSIAKGLNIGYGFEYRNEKYGINKGEEASYANYDPNGVQGSGSQGFPGFSPSDVVDAKRNSLSVYVDGELNVTDKWLVDAAVRAENYSDFGSLATFKLATRYKVADGFNLRGSASTGYRAPSLQQLNFSNTLTSFIGSNLIQSRLVANYDEVAQLAGIPALKQETSQSASLGFASKVAKGFSITIDGYVTKVKDRVVISGLFYADDASLPTAFTDKLNEIGVGSAQFFANAVNTTNYGLDIVVDYTKKWNNKTFKALLAGNFQELKIDKINVPTALNTNDDNREAFFGSREVTFLKSSAPQTKFNLSMSYSVKKLSVGTNLTYFGNVSTEGFGDVPTDANPNVFVSSLYTYKGKLVSDVFGSYKICKSVTLLAGVDNIFNVHPLLSINPLAKNANANNESGGPWDSVQMGFNGRRLFTKLAINF